MEVVTYCADELDEHTKMSDENHGYVQGTGTVSRNLSLRNNIFVVSNSQKNTAHAIRINDALPHIIHLRRVRRACRSAFRVEAQKISRQMLITEIRTKINWKSWFFMTEFECTGLNLF